ITTLIQRDIPWIHGAPQTASDQSDTDEGASRPARNRHRRGGRGEKSVTEPPAAEAKQQPAAEKKPVERKPEPSSEKPARERGRGRGRDRDDERDSAPATFE